MGRWETGGATSCRASVVVLTCCRRESNFRSILMDLSVRDNTAYTLMPLKYTLTYMLIYTP